jgi:hypothetical protein
MPLAVALLLLLVIGGSLAVLFGTAPLDLGAIAGDGYLRHVLLFTTIQALLSALLSVGLALPVARALARRTRFPGRTLLLRLFGLPMVMPAIIAVFAIVTLYGESGWLHRLAAGAGLPLGSFLYGLGGILIAHVLQHAAARTLPAGRARAGGELAPGKPARHAQRTGLPPDRGSGLAGGPCQHRRPRLHALLCQLRRHAHARWRTALGVAGGRHL